MSDNVKPLVSDNFDARYIQALGMHYSERKRKAGIILTNYTTYGGFLLIRLSHSWRTGLVIILSSQFVL